MLLIITMVSITAGCGADISKVANNHTEVMFASLENKAEAKSIVVEKPDAEKLTQELTDRIVQKTDENYEVKNFSTKDEIQNHLEEVASEELANKITNFYYEERNGSLFLKPTELFPWVNYENAYDLKKVSEFHYKLVQSNQTDLYDNYTIEINFKYVNNSWQIQNFNVR